MGEPKQKPKIKLCVREIGLKLSFAFPITSYGPMFYVFLYHSSWERTKALLPFVPRTTSKPFVISRLMEPVAGCVGEGASPRRVHAGRLLVGFLMKVAAQGPRYITAARCYRGPADPGLLIHPTNTIGDQYFWWKQLKPYEFLIERSSSPGIRRFRNESAAGKPHSILRGPKFHQRRPRTITYN